MVSTFSLFLPPGWSRIDLTDDVDRSIDRFTSTLARQAPLSRQPMVRQLVDDNLAPRLREFADQGIACLIMPTTPGAVDPIRPVVTITPIPTGEGADPLLMLQALAGGDPTAQIVEIEGLVAVRTHATANASASADEAQPLLDRIVADHDVPQLPVEAADLVGSGGELALVSSRIRYTMGDPDDRDKWVDVQMAVDHPPTPEAEELARGVIDLFDAVISTFRWDS